MIVAYRELYYYLLNMLQILITSIYLLLLWDEIKQSNKTQHPQSVNNSGRLRLFANFVLAKFGLNIANITYFIYFQVWEQVANNKELKQCNISV